MGGNLHHHRPHAFIRHAAKQCLQMMRLRRCHVPMEKGTADHIARGADKAGFHPSRFQHGLKQITGRSFALGARNADHLHLTGRISIQLRTHGAKGRAYIFYQDLRHVQGQQPFHYQSGSAVFHRLIHKIMGIEASAGNAEEQSVRMVFPAVHKGDDDFTIPLHLHDISCAGMRKS